MAASTSSFLHTGLATTARAHAGHRAAIDNVRVATVWAVPEAGTRARMRAGPGGLVDPARRRQA